MEMEARQEIKEALYSLRHQRYCTSRDLPENEKGYCKWCGKKTPDKRLKYCSEECTCECYIRMGHNIRWHVYQRDYGVCAQCGLHIGQANEYLYKYHILTCHNSWSWKPGVYKKSDWGPWWDINRNWWEADHIIPVVNGGGCCGLDNYQTLCIRCHKEDTKNINKESEGE